VKILVVDDQEDFTRKQCDWLREEGYDAVGIYSEKEARDYLTEKGGDISIAIIDMYMESKDSGLKFIRLAKESYPWIVPIVMTGHADFENAAKCMEDGCFSYIVKGETPINMIRQTIRKAVEHHQLITALPRIRSGVEELNDQFKEFNKWINKMSFSIQRLEDELSLIITQKQDLESNPDKGSISDVR